MGNSKIKPLTDFEKDFATANHNLIFLFLRRFNYNIEDYYSIAVMGYLQAVQAYCRREDLRKQYPFICISYQSMRSAIGNEIKKANTQKRKPSEQIISLDAEYDEMESLYNCIGGKSLESEIMEAENIAELLEKFSDLQRNIIILKLEGYNNNEICELLEIRSTSFYKELNKIKDSLMKNLVR